MRKELKIPYELLKHSELTEEEQRLEKAAIEAAKNAYAPYSKFNVGAAVLLENGEIITGSNQENAAYPSGLCAERTALFYAGAKYPNVPVLSLIIVAFNETGRVPFIPPCGSCRQVLMETASRFKPFKLLLAGADEVIRLDDCRTVLPFGFNKDSL